MSTYKNDAKCNTTLKVIYDLMKKSQSNTISSFDIREEIESKVELDGIEFYLILESLRDDGYIEEIEPLKNLVKPMHSTKAVVSITQKGVRYIESQ